MKDERKSLFHPSSFIIHPFEVMMLTLDGQPRVNPILLAFGVVAHVRIT